MAMQLSAYSPRDLQTIASVLIQADGAGLTVKELREQVDGYLAKHLQETGAMHGPAEPRRPGCPSCGLGILSPVLDGRRQQILIDGSPVLGCRLCRYSMIEGGK